MHGPRADRALAECPPSDPWCQLALADYELILASIGLPGDPRLAAEHAAAAAWALPGPASGRLRWAASLSGLAAAETPSPAPDADGLTAAVEAGGGRLSTAPGTWVLGIGPVAAPGIGAGAAVRFVHPDLGWKAWRLDLDAAGTSRRYLRVGAQLQSPGRAWLYAQAAGVDRPFDVYDAGGGVSTLRVRTAQVVGAPGFRWGRRRRWSAWAGPLLRWDGTDAVGAAGHGAAARLHVTGPARRVRAMVSPTVAVADYDHLDLRGDVRFVPAPGAGGVALWGQAAWAPLETSPLVRLPVAGGGQLLRAAPAGRFRAPLLTGAVVEWRSPTMGPLGFAVFAEGAAESSAPAGLALHGGGGAGLRLHLPPRPHNTVRLDAAVGDVGWALTAGFGEAF